MDIPQNFRTAVGGFRKEDVVRYLEYLNAKHTTEVNQLTAEADTLRSQIAELEEKASPEVPDCSQELEELKAQLEEASAQKMALEEKVADLQKAAEEKPQDHSEELQEAREEIEALKILKQNSAAEKQALQDRCAQLEAELQALKAQPTASEENLAERELEAYRRAERAERVANEKADLIYHRTNSVLDEAAEKIDSASTDLTVLAEKINAQLQQMQYSINSSKIALKSAVDTMHALRVDKD